jgi:hypothetical protein
MSTLMQIRNRGHYTLIEIETDDITHYTLHINRGHYALTKTYQQRKFEQQNKDHDHDHYLDYHHHIHRQPPCVTKKKAW